MSYCRWSTDDFQCDIYLYEDCSGGWTTCVASNRPVYGKPLPPQPEDPKDGMAWYHRHEAVMAMLDDPSTVRVPIGLEHDGQSFNSETLEELKALLLDLRAMGYRFPDYVLEDIDAEMAEAKGMKP